MKTFEAPTVMSAIAHSSSRARAVFAIANAVVSAMAHKGLVEPVNERQCRPLTKLPAEVQ